MNFWQRLRRALLIALIVVWCLAAASAVWIAPAPANPPQLPTCITNCL